MSMFARRHYEAIAEVCRHRLDPLGGTPVGRYDHEGFVRAFADLFERDNSRFDRHRFYVAAGLPEDYK